MVLITKHNWKKLTSCIYNKLRIKAIHIYFTRILQALEIQYDVIYYAGYKIFMSVVMQSNKLQQNCFQVVNETKMITLPPLIIN